MNKSGVITRLVNTLKRVLGKKDFPNKVMLIPDYICQGCQHPITIWFPTDTELLISCSCEWPELAPGQLDKLRADLDAGSLKLEEVF